ncbi:MAG: hypothetical protein ACK4QL_06960 [Pseudanabaenaceae cyanobacterium]
MDRRALVSRLAVLIVHTLKWQSEFKNSKK